jgi:hypothetical protein
MSTSTSLMKLERERTEEQVKKDKDQVRILKAAFPSKFLWLVKVKQEARAVKKASFPSRRKLKHL